jgi:hypothetical protein
MDAANQGLAHFGVAFLIRSGAADPKLEMIAVYAAGGGVDFVMQAWLPRAGPTGSPWRPDRRVEVIADRRASDEMQQISAPPVSLMSRLPFAKGAQVGEPYGRILVLPASKATSAVARGEAILDRGASRAVPLPAFLPHVLVCGIVGKSNR